MTATQKRKFDIDIAPTELKETLIDRQNAEQMKILTGGKKPPRPLPLPERRRKT